MPLRHALQSWSFTSFGVPSPLPPDGLISSFLCLMHLTPSGPPHQALVEAVSECSWCQVKASLSQDRCNPFQSQLKPPRCERLPPPPDTWASGVSSSLPRAQGILPSVQVHAFNFPSSKYVLLTWAGPLFPSGRKARTARGPRVPVPVAILAAGQRFGGSDMLSGQKKPATSQRKRAEMTFAVVGRASLELRLQALSEYSEFTSGTTPRTHPRRK